jgi:hypothetical protein
VPGGGAGGAPSALKPTMASIAKAQGKAAAGACCSNATRALKRTHGLDIEQRVCMY